MQFPMLFGFVVRTDAFRAIFLQVFWVLDDLARCELDLLFPLLGLLLFIYFYDGFILPDSGFLQWAILREQAAGGCWGHLWLILGLGPLTTL